VAFLSLAAPFLSRKAFEKNDKAYRAVLQQEHGIIAKPLLTVA
jgi:hypothetical protein